MTFGAAGIIAAGEGSRLRRDGYAAHKPLVEVAGVPLVEHVIGHLEAAGARRIVVIVNEEERDCARWLERRSTGIELDVIVKTTRSSLESLREVLRRMPPGPALVSTVDAFCRREDFVSFARAASAFPDETVLAVTPFVRDERPLWVSAEGDGRVARIGGITGDTVTAGVYVFPPRVRELDLPADLERLRHLLGWLVQHGEPVRAVAIGEVVDVDTAEDVALAEDLIARARLDAS